MNKNKKFKGQHIIQYNDIINHENFELFYKIFSEIRDNGLNTLDWITKELEDKKPYHGKILCAYPDNTSNTWRIDLRKHKIKYFPKYRSSYVNRFLTRQEAVEYIKKAEE